ncbi:hypothetical protein ACFV23_54940, partial [Streptomyces sp. NPDC059627]
AGWRPGWGTGIPVGVVLGRAGSFLIGLASTTALLEEAEDIRMIATPAALLAIDRRRTVQQALITGALHAMGMSLILVAALGTRWLPVGLAVGAMSGAWKLVTIGAWPRWAVLVRCWLPVAERQLPLRVAAFLEDAHRSGVLRQAGPVYQFRHARLQRHLALARRRPDTRSPSTRQSPRVRPSRRSAAGDA